MAKNRRPKGGASCRLVLINRFAFSSVRLVGNTEVSARVSDGDKKATPVPFRKRRAGSRRWLNPYPIVDGRSDALPRSQVLLRGLNRDVSEQKLDLIQLAARTPAEPSAGSP